MNSRVKLIRTQLNLSQKAFGKRLGVTAAGISKIESGQRNLTDQMAILMCKEFDINEAWLRNGSGEMFRRKLSTGMKQLSDYYHLDDLDVKIIHEYLLLEDDKRKVIKDYIMNIASETSRSDLLVEGGAGRREILQCAEASGLQDTV